MFWLNFLAFSLSLFKATYVSEVVFAEPNHMPVVVFRDYNHMPVAGVGYCPAPCCDAPMFQALPVCTPSPAKLYHVELHLNGGPKAIPPARLNLMVPEGVAGSMEPIGFYNDSGMKSCTLATTIKPAGGDRVELDVQLLGKGCFPAYNRCEFHDRRTVRLNTVTNLVLANDGPEPCCAEVTVREVTSEPQPPQAACLPCPYVCPVSSYTMPAPMPCPTATCYPMPSCAPLPEPIPVARPCVSPFQPCAAMAPATTRTSRLSIVRDKEKSRVRISSPESSITCVRMTMEGGEAGKLIVTAGKKRVHVKGKEWKAEAERIDIRSDGMIVLRGQVKLLSDKIGVCASVKADELHVKVKHGEFDRIIGKGSVDTRKLTDQRDVSGRSTPVSPAPCVIEPVRMHGGLR